MVAHQAKHLTESKYKCELCGKHFPSQSSVWKHTKAHSGERPFVWWAKPRHFSCCVMRDEDASRFFFLVLWVGGKLKFSSSPTDDKYVHRSSLDSYVIHSSICNKAFTQLANLQRHNLVHNGECCMTVIQSTTAKYNSRILYFKQVWNHTSVPAARRHFPSMLTWWSTKCCILVSNPVGRFTVRKNFPP